ncbi:thiamine-binding protein [Xylanimonas protaetiae]|uniref:Thiamine-binding protein n=1 Tax=Xylanimonas protaetiae TaxID=2509457 RepID=A0A4P6FF21_9MICO|nr:thiamine-binding protein [Xylanimonas protaetiae]QAY69208.1 thiamine-binding protein [Xylanimonas protaetiae]
MAVFAFSVAPLGAGESVAPQVAEAVRIVRESGLPNRTSSMFTEIEGEWDEVMPVIKKATEAVGIGGHRVSLVLKADIRPGFTGQLDAKVSRVEAILADEAVDEGRS